MRLSLSLPLTLTVAALALSGCVQNPGTMPPTAIVPPVVTPNPDAAVRSSARVVVNREMAKRLPGANVAPYTDCVLQNATTAELASIADSGADGAGNAVASIVGRPATSQCIAGAAAAAKGVA